ncbi:MRNIP protein, partial [Alectura lathami]|nr:MRNIP protein [Alectura lathami]
RAPRAVVLLLLQLYGQGSGRDCRLHVQKLNLLQGEAEEAVAATSRYCVEYCLALVRVCRPRVLPSQLAAGSASRDSRWSKYLEKGHEDEEEEEEESTERQQFCSRRKNAVEEQRKQQKSFLYSDVQEYSEENRAFQLAYQAKKHKKCSTAVPDQEDGGGVSAGRTVPAVCKAVEPQENKQTPTARTKPSKWEKFLSHSDYSENAAVVTLSPQDGSGRLGLCSTTAVSAATRRSGQDSIAPPTGFDFKNCSVSTEQLALELPGSMLPHTTCSDEDALVKEPRSQLLWAGSGGFDISARPHAATLVNSNTGLKASTTSCKPLFCTGEEFDDDF